MMVNGIEVELDHSELIDLMGTWSGVRSCITALTVVMGVITGCDRGGFDPSTWSGEHLPFAELVLPSLSLSSSPLPFSPPFISLLLLPSLY